MTREEIIAAGFETAHERIDPDYNKLCDEVKEHCDNPYEYSENDESFVAPYVLGAEWMQEQLSWISVEYGLPQEGEVVLTHDIGGAVMVNEFDGDGWKYDNYNTIDYYLRIPELPEGGFKHSTKDKATPESPLPSSQTGIGV